MSESKKIHFQFHWMDSPLALAFLARSSSSLLSIPLNGFRLYSRASSCSYASRLSIPLNGFGFEACLRPGFDLNFQFHWMDSRLRQEQWRQSVLRQAFQFHWMDSVLQVTPPASSGYIQLAFNSIEWIPLPGLLGDIGYPHGFQFHWMDSRLEPPG